MFRPPPININSHILDISIERFFNYRTIFKTTDLNELHGIYCWNEEISTKFIYLIGMIEITLRNKIHRCLSHFYFTNQLTLCSQKLYGNVQSCNWYDHLGLTHNNKLFNAIDSAKKKNGKYIQPVPAPHRIISTLENGRWAHILKINKTSNGTIIPWEQIFPNIFQYYPYSIQQKSHPKDIKNRHRIIQRLLQTNKLRNRCAHFEPIWKFGNLINEFDSSIIKSAPNDIASTLSRLKLEYRHLIDLLGWLSSDMQSYHLNSFTHKDLVQLIHIDGLTAFKLASSTKKIALSKIGRKHNLKKVLRDGQSVLLTDKGRIVGRFLVS